MAVHQVRRRVVHEGAAMTELREYWTTGPGAVDIRPDPRLSNLRPGWLDGDGWRDRLSALRDEDVEWIERQWELASGARPVPMIPRLVRSISYGLTEAENPK